MNSAVEAGLWSPRHWYGVVSLFFIGQLMVIFWLGQRTPIQPRPALPGPVVRLASPRSADLLALTDPTLFALPHRQGFSGPAWLNVAPLSFQPFVWTESTRWLALPLEQLGAAFHQFIATNQFKPLRTPAQPEPELLLPEFVPAQMFPAQSLLRVNGQLASRTLLTSLNLPSWTNSFILSNTVIQVVVTAVGEPFPVVAEPKTSSGYAPADDFALAWARGVRFAPLAGATKDSWALHPLTNLSFGELVFQWHTLPLLDTNAVAQKP